MRSPPEDGSLDSSLALVDTSLQAGDLDTALEQCEYLARAFPRNIEALRCRADVLSVAGELEEACAVYRRALELAPDDVETLHSAVELLIQDLEGDHDAAEEAMGLLERAIKLAQREGDKARQVDLHLLAASALGTLGESRRALAAVELACTLAPGDPEVLAERGIALFELCRLDEASEQFASVLRVRDATPWAHYYLGLIAEYKGDSQAAKRCFARARRLAPEKIPSPVEISQSAFDRAVEQALEGLPSQVRDYLSNVPIIVEELPELEELRASEPPLSPCSVGMFRGTPITEQSNSSPWDHFPSAILLFQRNLQRFARDREELVEQIGITLIHEVGHFLGLNEEDLYDRGLD